MASFLSSPTELRSRFGVLALVAVAVVMLLPAASAAMAQDELQAGQYPAKLTGAQLGGGNVWTFDGSNASCETANLEGTISEAATTFTVHPTFSGCTVIGFVGGTISTTGCDFKFTVGEETKAHHHEAQADLICSEANKVKFTGGTCELHLASQSLPGSVELIDNTEASPRSDVTIAFSLKEIAFDAVKDGFLCPLPETGERSNGTFAGEQTATAENPSNSSVKYNLSVSDTPPTESSLQAGQYPAKLTGAQLGGGNVWTFDGSNASCETANLEGTISEAATTFTVHPTFSGCTVIGFVGGTISTTGCDFKFTVGEETKAHHHEAQADLICSEANKVKFTGGTCELHLASQSLPGSVELIDNTEASPRSDVTIAFSLKEIAFDAVKDGFLCPLPETGERSNGTFAGEQTATAENPSNSSVKYNLSVSDTPPTESSLQAGQYPAKLTGLSSVVETSGPSTAAMPVAKRPTSKARSPKPPRPSRCIPPSRDARSSVSWAGPSRPPVAISNSPSAKKPKPTTTKPKPI